MTKKQAWSIGFLLGNIVVQPIIIMLLWNWLSPELFGGPEITFLQSLGLRFLVANILPDQNVTIIKDLTE